MFDHETTIETFPAYKVIKRSKLLAKHPEFFAGEVIGIKHYPRGYYDRYILGSVVSYALESGLCPIKTFEQAKANGHKLWWANPVPVSLTSGETEREIVYAVNYEETIIFQGREFIIRPDYNNNIKLVEKGE